MNESNEKFVCTIKDNIKPEKILIDDNGVIIIKETTMSELDRESLILSLSTDVVDFSFLTPVEFKVMCNLSSAFKERVNKCQCIEIN